MDNRPVGFFDSGFGGLTALRAFRKLMPDENIIYFGDTGRMPYGARPAAQLRRMTAQDLDLLRGFGVKAIISACGTTSSTAGDILDAYSLPVTGVLRPGVKTLAGLAGGAPLGVIATKASIDSGAFRRELERYGLERGVIYTACPDFVPLIESGHYSPDDALIREAVARYLRPMKDAGVGAILLGCTHYGLISAAIEDYMGAETRLVSASECAARELSDKLRELDMTGGCGEERYLTSGETGDFGRMAAIFLGWQPKRGAEHIAPMEVE